MRAAECLDQAITDMKLGPQHLRVYQHTGVFLFQQTIAEGLESIKQSGLTLNKALV